MRVSRELVLIGAALVGACSPTEAPEAGVLNLALRSAGADGAMYRLREATWQLDGAADATISGEAAGPDADGIAVDVPAGWTQVTLTNGWYLETERNGGWTSVDAWLVSENPQWVEVYPGVVSRVDFTFQLDSGEFVGPSGGIILDITVNAADRSICAPGETHQIAGPTPYDDRRPFCGYGGRLYALDNTLLEGPGSQFCECVPEDACLFRYRGGRFAEPLESESNVACNADGELYWDGVPPYRDADWCVCVAGSAEATDCPTGTAYRLTADAPFDPDTHACGYQGRILDLGGPVVGVPVADSTSAYCECVPEEECTFQYLGHRFTPELNAAWHVGCTADGRLYWDDVAPFRDTEYCGCR